VAGVPVLVAVEVVVGAELLVVVELLVAAVSVAETVAGWVVTGAGWLAVTGGVFSAGLEVLCTGGSAGSLTSVTFVTFVIFVTAGAEWWRCPTTAAAAGVDLAWAAFAL
jgi:hypothetical protein